MAITREEIFVLYIKALRARRLAVTEGDWEIANNKVRVFKEYLDKHPKA